MILSVCPNSGTLYESLYSYIWSQSKQALGNTLECGRRERLEQCRLKQWPDSFLSLNSAA